MTRRGRSGFRIHHLVLALLLLLPPAVRVGAPWLRDLRPPSSGEGSPGASEALEARLAAALEELRRAKLDLATSGIDSLRANYRLVLADPLPFSDPSPRRSTIWASLRSPHEVPECTAAIGGEALAGRVVRVHPRLGLARIQTLLDPAFRVRFRQGGTSGMLWGTGRTSGGRPVLEIRHLSETIELAPGQAVFTEGGDGIYPDGVLIGFIVEEDGAGAQALGPLPAAPRGSAGRLAVKAALEADGADRLALAVDLRKPRLEEAVRLEAAAARIEAEPPPGPGRSPR